MKKLIFIMVVLFLFCSVSAFATPLFDQINFKTRTTLLPGTYSLRFSLWDASAKGGTMVWSEDHTVVLSDTVIDVTLGETNPLPDLDYNLPWYVQVDLVSGTSYKALSKTRSMLGVIPTALWSLDSGSGGSITAVNAGTGLSGGGTFGDVTLSLTTPVAITNGGTGSGTASGARTNLSAAASGENTDITSLGGLSTQAAITINPYDTTSGSTGEVRLKELAANGSEYVGFKAPDKLNADTIWTLPPSDGTADQVLKTDGSGNLGWASAVTGDITGVTAGTGLTGGGTSGDVTISLSTPVSIGNGGTGSTTQNFVDLTTLQTVGGAKTFSNDLTLSANLNLPATTGTTAGVIKSGSNRLIHTYGTENFFAGVNAGNLTTTGYANTASGNNALKSNTTGFYNTASGHSALYLNTTGSSNTASGYYALYSNTTGIDNTAIGRETLYYNTIGNANTASGYYALYANTTGSFNTASGFNSLSSNISGSENTASGHYSLVSNTAGSYNTAIGYSAGSSQTTGSNNIYVGYNVTGTAGESNITRIGNGQTDAYIAGILHGNGSGLTNISASSVTNGVYTTGSYSDPAWLTSLSGSKISGNISGNAANVTGTVAIANGGTGSTSQNFVDLTNPQTVGGAKTFSNDVTLSANLNLPATTGTTAGVIKSGTNTLIHTYGTENFFAGLNAGNLTMSGNYNTAGGANALNANTTGIGNTASGDVALFHNTIGNYNTASGAAALYSNTEGNNNTASGNGALYDNTTGYDNTADGFGALNANTTGNYNTASGALALYSNTTASKNTALGISALYTQSYNNAGTAWDSHNTAVGFEALYSNQPANIFSGTNNTALGSQALRANTEGTDNTASGYAALSSNTTGFNNTASGSVALNSNTTGFNNTASGIGALFSNTDGYENTANGLGALSSNTGGFANTACGSRVLSSNTIGVNNTAAGVFALFFNTTGSHNTAIGDNADVSSGNLTNATAIGSNAIVDASNHVRIGNTNVTQIGGQVAWSNLSDLREKKDVKDLTLGLDFIKSLRPVEFKLINGNDRTDFGFIAQDIEALLGTDYNVLGIGGTEEHKLSLRYTDFIAPMVKAMQEQQEIIEEQKAKIQSLEERLARIEALMTGK